MEHLSNCPICGSSRFKPVFKAPYFRGSKEYFQIVECIDCALRITNPRPKEGAELNAYYETEDYVSHTDEDKGLVNKLYLLVRARALKAKFSLVSRHAAGKSLCDYGAGTGAFLAYAKNKGWDTIGVEPSEVARQQALKKGVVLKAPEQRQEIEPESVDAITMWHVLEHLPQLNDDIKFLKSILKNGGKLIIAVPNHESKDAAYYGENWAAYDMPLHLYHFKKSNIAQLGEKHGFALKEVKNMPFDSFYVSMLSEKIKKGKNNFLGAFWRGLISNLAGMGRKKNMSSLIYVLEKR